MLLLDELTRRLDVEEWERAFALARQPASGRLILSSTHEPADGDRLADRMIVLRQGRAIFSGETDDLRRQAWGAVHQVIVPVGEEILGHVTARQEAAFDGKTALWVVGPRPYGHLGTGRTNVRRGVFILAARTDSRVGQSVNCQRTKVVIS